MKLILNLTWCLLQNILGIIVLTYCKITNKIIGKCEVEVKKGKFVKVYKWNVSNGSLSLGEFRFVYGYYSDDIFAKVAKHEYGHTIQSYILGWFYLLVIGLPSLIWANCFGKYRQKKNIPYYSFYTEKWANKLIGI